jgi:hypothetical protein
MLNPAKIIAGRSSMAQRPKEKEAFSCSTLRSAKLSISLAMPMAIIAKTSMGKLKALLKSIIIKNANENAIKERNTKFLS